MQDKTNEILEKVFPTSVDTMQDIQARNLIADFVKEHFYNTDSLSVSIFVKDVKKQHWKRGDHFTKIFNDEIKHAKEYYSLTRAEINFLYSLSPYLKWEMNLLVDEEDKPLNQIRLAQELEVQPKTVRKHIKMLIEKKIIFGINVGKEIFYFVNPFLMYCGQNINMLIPTLFQEIGYKNSNNDRNNRRKKVIKRSNIKDL